MMIYFKVIAIFVIICVTQGQTRNSHRENYLRGYGSKYKSAYLPNPGKIIIATLAGLLKEHTGCVEALLKVNQAISHPDKNGSWALNMVDSWGKSNDGFLYGTPYILGSYDQCLRAASPDKTIKGKYCSIFKFNINSTVVSKDIASVEWNGDSFQWKTLESQLIRQPIQWRGQTLDKLMKEVFLDFQTMDKFSLDILEQGQQQFGDNGLFKGKKHSMNILNNHQSNGSAQMGGIPIYHPYGFLAYGTCVPHVCTPNQINVGLIDGKPENRDHWPWVFACDEQDEEISLDSVDICFISFCAVIGFLMLAGTIAHAIILYSKQENLAKGPLRFILPFAVSLNLKKIFTTNSRPAPGTISCLNGMRVMSMCWVIWGHQNLFTIYAMANQNNLYMLDNFLAQIVTNADLSVDSFFFMSGLLVCYGVMKELIKTGKLNIIMYYVHRIIRLTPPIAMVVWYCSTLYRFQVRGPIPVSMSTRPNWMASYCRDNGWRDITYVSNIAFRNDQGIPMGCMGQCWYTSVDTQLYVLAPLLLLPLYYYKTAGRAWVYVVTLWAIIMRGFITWNERNTEKGVDNPWMYDNYFPTWVRADSWLIGIWTGYFIFNKGKKKLDFKSWQVVLGWTVAVAFGLMVMFGRYHSSYTGVNHIMYEMTHRTVWASCLAWVTIACHYGYGGVVNYFLSHPSWQPFSRLTYTTYLVAQEFTIALTNASRTLFYYSHINKIIETCGILFICNIFALLVSLSVEAPILGLEKLLLKRPGRGIEEVTDKKPSASPSPNNNTAGFVSRSPDHNNHTVPPVSRKSLPPGSVNSVETFGGSENVELQHSQQEQVHQAHHGTYLATGQDNVAFETSEKENIPLKDFLVNGSEELEQHQQVDHSQG